MRLESKYVSLAIIDVNGNFTSRRFSIDISPLLPPPKQVFIPDANLAAAVKEEIGNRITTHSILNLTQFSVSNSGITDLTGLEHAHSLVELDLGGNYVAGKGWVNSNAILDFSPLAGLTQLSTLDLSNSNLTDISGLAGLTQLTELDLWGNNITDISGLAGLTQLRRLYLMNNNLTDISGLAGLTQLRGLHAAGNKISDIPSLAGLTQLRRLELSGGNITDISGLAGLTQLTDLTLGGNITDISGLAEFTHLTDLTLGVNITDISGLAGLTQLTKLYLTIGGGTLTDTSVLAEFTHLTDLGLPNNNLTDISGLAGLTHLRRLYLWNNNISDISALSTLENLTSLGLELNNISDISALSTLEKLTSLDLRKNPLNNASIRTHIPAMQARGIVIYFDNITHPELLIISGDKQEELFGRTLPSPFVVEYRDANGKPEEGVEVTFSITDGDAELTDTTVTTDADGRAQTFLIFGWKLGTITVRATAEGGITPLTFTAYIVLPENHVAEDVNADGVVDVEDLVLVAATIGTIPPEDTYPNPDVNGDGVVNRDDLAVVMAALETTPAAPAAVITAENLQRWIDAAKRLTNRDETFQRGIAVLEQLLSTLLPEKTALLANYPNPFNPETWIPYHLSKPAKVKLTIYGIDGNVVRHLDLGHQVAGFYQRKSRAAYWDGRNNIGEPVVSGVYFYTLTAGEFTATRKMLIRK